MLLVRARSTASPWSLVPRAAPSHTLEVGCSPSPALEGRQKPPQLCLGKPSQRVYEPLGCLVCSYTCQWGRKQTRDTNGMTPRCATDKLPPTPQATCGDQEGCGTSGCSITSGYSMAFSLTKLSHSPISGGAELPKHRDSLPSV